MGLDRYKRMMVEIGKRIDVVIRIRTGIMRNRAIYFEELFRIASRRLFGEAELFHLPPSEYFIIWDGKQQ